MKPLSRKIAVDQSEFSFLRIRNYVQVIQSQEISEFKLKINEFDETCS